MIIALDAMGGDNAPSATIQGALETVQDSNGIDIILVGDQGILESHLKGKVYDKKRLTIHHAPEVVDMSETTSKAIRQKKHSSIRLAVELVKKSQAAAVVSAGHTGVAMATSFMQLGRIPGVDRPAIAVLMPTLTGFFLLIDAGANVHCKPVNLLQFAYMGSAYLRTAFNIDSPRVAVLSIGEEDSKGNDLTKEAFKLLKKTNLNFVGNIEGQEVFKGNADVVLCDGFIGNTVLKVSEGLAEAIISMLKSEISSMATGKIGYLFMKPALKKFRERTDYAEYGGAPLLGLNGTSIICHGRSTPKAIKNALKVTKSLVEKNITKIISDEISQVNNVLEEKEFIES